MKKVLIIVVAVIFFPITITLLVICLKKSMDILEQMEDY